MTKLDDPNRILVCDETLRDGSQGPVVMTPAFKIRHLLYTFGANPTGKPLCDQARIGWHSNPGDQQVLNYLYNNGLKHIYENVTMFTLLPKFRFDGDHWVVDEADQVFTDYKNDKRFGTANILTKAKPEDVVSELHMKSPDEAIDKLRATIRALKEAQPDRPVELSMEHFFAAYLDSDPEKAERNQQYIIDSLVAVLQEGCDRILVPDTDGQMEAHQIEKVLIEVTQKLQTDQRLADLPKPFSPSQFIIHTHNDLQHGSANVQAGISAGAGMVDLSWCNYGERAGNTSFLQYAMSDVSGSIRSQGKTSTINQDNLAEVRRRTDEMHELLGSEKLDQTPGEPGSFGAYGGMHAAKLWRTWEACRDAAHQAGAEYTIEDFKKGFDHEGKLHSGSYCAVNSGRFDHSFFVAVSPIAGKSNLCFLLEEMGERELAEKAKKGSDPEVNSIIEKEVLVELKDGEWREGTNYRGKNNANAKLMIAEKLGIREFGNEPKQKNSIVIEREGAGFNLILNGKKVAASELEGDIRFARGKDKLTAHAHEVMDPFLQKFQSILSANGESELLKGLELEEVRQNAVEVGEVTHSGDPTQPRVEDGNRRTTVRLKFKNERLGEFSAFGTAKDRTEAMVEAVQKAMDFMLMNYEVSKKKQGASPVIEDRGITTLQTTAPILIPDSGIRLGAGFGSTRSIILPP